jgi:hypothetical protein
MGDQTQTPDESTLTKPAPKRGRRFRTFDEGDYLIMQVAPQPESGMPPGTLVPIPDMPHHENCAKALAWLRENGHLVTGMQLMILKAHRILGVQTATRQAVELIEKPRVVSHEPVETE